MRLRKKNVILVGLSFEVLSVFTVFLYIVSIKLYFCILCQLNCISVIVYHNSEIEVFPLFVCRDMDFKVGQPIEIIADGSGFRASYYTGTVVQVYDDYNERVAVRYDKVKDYNGNPLVDDLPKEDLRPVAPKVDVNLETNDIVNAWDGEGWWNGKLIQTAGNLYTVDLGSESDPKIEVFRKKHLRINQRWQMLEHGQHRWVYVKNQ